MIESTFNGDDQWSDNITIQAGGFGLSIWGTFVAIITIQRSFDRGINWLDVDTFDHATEQRGVEPEGSLYRAGIKPGEYVSGTVNIRIGV